MRVLLIGVGVFVSLASAAAAQGSKLLISPPVVLPPRAGATEVRGACAADAMVHLTVATNGTKVMLPEVSCAKGVFTVDTSMIRLEVGSQLSATQTVENETSGSTTVDVMLDGPFGDEREDFESSAYVGLAIDRFAAQEIQRYLNPEENAVQHERNIFGIDFEYRLGSPENTDRAPQLWVFGETLHGVRSQDVTCEATSFLPSCKKALADFVGDASQSTLYMLRNASTLEAFVGMRFEFFGLNLPGGNPARLYIKGQLGFVEVTRGDGDARDMHHVALGATTVGGSRAGSYLEVGYGRTDLFELNPRKRFKIDGHFQQLLGAGVSLFAQIFADVDGNIGADAIQSYYGLSFDVGQIVGTIQAAAR